MDFNYDIKMNIPNKITYKTCLAINSSPGSQKGIEETFNSNLNPMVNENKITPDCLSKIFSVIIKNTKKIKLWRNKESLCEIVFLK